MPRPCKYRRVGSEPKVNQFSPCGVAMSELEFVTLSVDEFEAIRLADMEGLYQQKAAENMNVSRQTFGNILVSAHNKIADAIVNAKAIRIEGGTIQMAEKNFICSECNHTWSTEYGSGRPCCCPECKCNDIHRSDQDRINGGRCRRRSGHGQCRRGQK